MEHLSIDGYDPIFGARPLKRLIQREIVDRIAEKVVQGTLRDRSHVLIDINAEGDYECAVEEPLDLDSITLDAEPGGVSTEGGALVVRRGREVIARFRRYTAWWETTPSTE